MTANFGTSLKSINHIIFLAQENRSFDSYFGALRAYWAANNIPDQALDGLPQFNPGSSTAPSVPGCDPTQPFPTSSVCVPDPANPISSYHFNTMCVENPSPSWNESHVDWNYNDPTGATSPTAALNGFVKTAADDARQITPPFNDTNGIRSMGYYDGGDLNYYYFLASSFATSDRWFSPVMSRTPPNREYLIGATSTGYVYPEGVNPPADSSPIASPTIFQELQAAGITWKIYVHPKTNPDGSQCSTTQCLYNQSYIQSFTWGQTVLNQYPQNLVSTDQFITDAQNGTLPQVAQIEPASQTGLDEHPADSDPTSTVPACCSVQAGANYVSTLINAVMGGPSWKDSAFILTFDEFGGFYDHVQPQPAVSPDGIKPVDLFSGDVCTLTTGPLCDFTFTGYRVPMIVISPFTKKNFVSHTVADNTAILKLIETRFGVNSLTARDAAQIDMSQEFFDFTTVPWKTPPSVPAQNTGGQCYLDHLP
ncbi:MAG: phospholipase C [Terriglobales bacterium]